MIANNKIISLTVLGLVIGLILGLMMSSGKADILLLSPFGGIVGFLAGWIWQSRSEKSEA